MGISRRDLMRIGGSAAILAMAARSGVALAANDDGFDPLPYIDPELRDAAAQMLKGSAEAGPMNDARFAAMRKGPPRYQAPRLPDVPVEERKIPVPGNNPDVTIYVINAKAGGKRPGILHMHGGGYILGQAKAEVPFKQALAKTLGCVIVTVEYRLAPETTYKGSVEDDYAGLKWMHDHAKDLGLDTSRIAVMGESAGGGLAARLAITARDRGEVPVALQVLIYPMLDDRTGSSHMLPPPIGSIGWTPDMNRFGWKAFLGQDPGGPDVPAAGVPARVKDLSGLPPAFIGVGSVDLFAPEDTHYATRLMEARVPTELLVVPGAFHGFDRVVPKSYVAKMFTKAKLNVLRRAFGQPVEA